MKRILFIIGFLISTISLFGQITNADGSYRTCYGDGPPVGDVNERYSCREYLDTTNNVKYIMVESEGKFLNRDSLIVSLIPSLSSDRINVDTLHITGGAGDQGVMTWNSDEETVDLILNGSVLQMGQENHVHCRNNSGADIADGKVVMKTGTIGASSRITIGLYDGVSDPMLIIGVTTEAIQDGTDGKVTPFGKVRGIQTDGVDYGEVWAEDDILYATSSGGFTNVVPVGINVPLALVVEDHVSNGTLMVRLTPIDLNATGGASLWEDAGVTGDTIQPVSASIINLASGLTGEGSGLRIDDNFRIFKASTNKLSFNVGTGVTVMDLQYNAGYGGYVLSGSSSTNPSVRFGTTPSSTVPVFCPDADDENTGLGWNTDDAPSIVAGGVEAMRFTESAGDIDVTTYGTLSMAANGIGYDASNPGIFFNTDGNMALGERAEAGDVNNFIPVKVIAYGGGLANAGISSVYIANDNANTGTDNYLGFGIGGSTSTTLVNYGAELNAINFGEAVISARDNANGMIDLVRILASDSTAYFIHDINVGGDIIGQTRTLVYNIDVSGATTSELTWIGEYRVEASGQTGDYATDFGTNNQHASIEVNSITGSGVVTFTGVSMSEGTGLPTATTEDVTVDATGKYQTDKKWLEITNIDIPAGITAINYDVEVLGYLDMQNTDFEILGMRVDMQSVGVNSNIEVHIMKVQDDGSKKCSLVDIEKYGIDASSNEYVDDLRTAGDDRSYTTTSALWTNGENACLKVNDYSTWFSSDENILEGSSKAEGIIIHLQGTGAGNINNVSNVTLHLTIKTL